MLTNGIQSYIAHCWVGSRMERDCRCEGYLLVGLKFGTKKDKEHGELRKDQF